jgi:hypothetical protein
MLNRHYVVHSEPNFQPLLVSLVPQATAKFKLSNEEDLSLWVVNNDLVEFA